MRRETEAAEHLALDSVGRSHRIQEPVVASGGTGQVLVASLMLAVNVCCPG